ncbi:META domain-containing protein [Flavobacterium sp. SM15]|uniref:META domain-containing protein n=1 Tax=Flavobacterium sp. SM15 TaxID=2908005 RepID=UPI001EDC6CB6|nr:META domain-containing protein [Flavobacterium sp. SM15]MCG2612346.1 META domain-containing protein [Flavobacterium sp. SM15]
MKHSLLLFLSALIMTACTSTKTSTSTQNTNTETNTPPYFKASGNEPFWGLTISESVIELQSLADDKTYSFSHVMPIKAMDANVKMYRTENTEAKLEITIQQQDCINDMSGEKSPYIVSLNLTKKNGKSESLKGCGSYQLPLRFHDIWALESLNGKKVTASDFAKQIPYFEIDSKKSSYSGYGGCNGMGGSLFYEPGILRFEKGISTMMYCGDNNKENEFHQALNKVTQYEFKDTKLVLSNPSGVLVVMKKVD